MRLRLNLLVLALTAVMMMGLGGCSKTRIYYGSFTKDMGGMVWGYLMIKGDDNAEIHFLSEKESSEGAYVRDGDHLSMKFPDPHEEKQYLSLEVEEKQGESGWIVEGRFHWDFGGKMGIDGTVKMSEYKGEK